MRFETLAIQPLEEVDISRFGFSLHDLEYICETKYKVFLLDQNNL